MEASARRDSIDLRECEQERIERLGLIQPHGFLLVLDEQDLSLIQVSENAGAFLGFLIQNQLGQPIARLLTAETVRDLLCRLNSDIGSSPRFPLRFRDSARECSATISRGPGRILLECCPSSIDPTLNGARDHGLAAPQMMARLNAQLDQTGNAYRLAHQVATTVREATGYARVMVYRFQGDWSGEVIAEARADRLAPYLGLRYPASDIPPPARELYRRKLERVIVDIRATPAALLPALDPRTGESPDLGMVNLRQPSHYHVDYLANIGVIATLTLSIMVDGELWGMIACHHDQPKQPSADEVELSVTIAHTFARRIERRRAENRLRVDQHAAQLATDFDHHLRAGGDPVRTLTDRRVGLAFALEADGMAIACADRVLTLGLAPSPAEVIRLAGELAQTSDQRWYFSDHLAATGLNGGIGGDICGVAAVVLSREPLLCLIGFRSELLREFDWGIEPTSAGPDSEMPSCLTPRNSFSRWKQTVRGHSAAWSDRERLVLEAIADHLQAWANGDGALLDHIATRLDRDAAQFEDPAGLIAAAPGFVPSEVAVMLFDPARPGQEPLFYNHAFSRNFLDGDRDLPSALSSAGFVRFTESETTEAGEELIELWCSTRGRRVVLTRRNTILQLRAGQSFQRIIAVTLTDVDRLVREEDMLKVAFARADSAERALLDSAERLRDYAEAASDWFWETDADLRFRYFAGRMREATGIDPKVLIGRTRRELVLDPTDQAFQDHLKVLDARQPFRDFCYQTRHVSGATRIFKVSGKPAFRSDGSFQGYRGVGVDITERIRTETALARAEIRFRDLIEGSVQGICIVDRDFKFLFCNDAWAQLFGYGRGTDIMAERSLERFVPEERQTAARTQLTAKLTGEVVAPIACETFLTRSGSPIWLDLASRRIEWQGETALQITATDGTARILRERELVASGLQAKRQAEDLIAFAERLEAARAEAERLRKSAEAANRAKSLFLAVMSHELRTPMTGIFATLDLLGTTPLDPEQAEWVRTLRGSATAMLSLLNDVLDYSKIEADGLRLEAVDFNVGATIQEVAQLFGPAAAEKGLQLRTMTLTGAGLQAVGDANRLKQILTNLTGNAIKFTDHGEIAVRLLSVADHGTGRRRFEFDVADTGIGMTDDTVKQLFQPFSQGDPSIARRFGGTGLGLAISRRLVEAMGGAITVTSTPGQGTTFKFWISLSAPSAQAAAPVPKSPQAGVLPLRPRRILLAEDDPVNRKLIAAMLDRMGHSVKTVEDGREAVAAVEAEIFDVILMDMRMPGMSGLDATRAIRALTGPAAHTPVVAITADASAGHRETYRTAGLDGFLSKPVDWAKLAATVGSLALRENSSDHAASARSLPNRPINPDRLRELLRFLDATGLQAMLEQAALGCTDKAATIATAAANGDHDLARDLAHDLSGLAGNFGFEAVFQAATVLQQSDNHGFPGQLPGLTAAVATLNDRLPVILRQELRSAGLDQISGLR